MCNEFQSLFSKVFKDCVFICCKSCRDPAFLYPFVFSSADSGANEVYFSLHFVKELVPVQR